MTPEDAAAGNRGGARYLRYVEERPVYAGMNHWLSNLECLLGEAHATGRLAVLPELRLAARHNLGVDGRWRWETYFDLGRSRLAGSGAEHPLPLADRPPPGAGPFVLDGRQRIPPAAADRVLVERRLTSYLYRRQVPAAGHPALRLRMAPSARVLALARPAIDALAARAEQYAAVHIRRGDRLKGLAVRRLTSPRGVRRCLERNGVAPGATVFFLSDECDPAYWEALRARYDLVRYTDFPQLAALVHTADGARPDNYLLYEVEKEIMRNASLRVETFPGLGRVPAHASLVPRPMWAVIRATNVWTQRLAAWVRPRGRVPGP